jgi:hypothetical protein
VWCKETKSKHPALLVPCYDGNHLARVQAVLLDPATATKAKVAAPKLTFGQGASHVPARFAARASDDWIILTEGPEDAVVLNATMGWQADAALSAGTLEKIIYPTQSRLLLFGDNGIAGAQRTLRVVLVLVAPMLLLAHAARALTITPSFDSSITGAPNAAAIERSISDVITTYDHLIQDPIDVSIFFTRTVLPSNFLSQSLASLYAVPYDSYAIRLAANALVFRNPVLSTAVSNLAHGNSGQRVVDSSAGLRALGDTTKTGLLGTDGVRGHGTLDGIVYLSSGPGLQYSRPVLPHHVDARWAIAHEIDEVLGIGGAAGSILNAAFDSGLTSPPFFGGVIGDEDLYRYAAPGVPSLSLSPDATAFFSIDGGVDDLAQFNQDHNFDYADWFAAGSCLPLVQRAAFCSELSVNFTRNSPEAIALQAIGYDLTAIPEPPAGILFLVGLGVLLLAKRPSRYR